MRVVSTTILGYNFSAPFFICPAALAGSAHPGGEINLVEGAAAGDILYVASSYSTYTIEEIHAAKKQGQVVFQQVRANVATFPSVLSGSDSHTRERALPG